MMLYVTRFFLVLCALELLNAQEPIAPPSATFEAYGELGLVGFSVKRHGKYVADIQRYDIQILEDGIPQPIVLFEVSQTTRTMPMDVILVFDCRRAMRLAGLVNPRALTTQLLDGQPNIRIGVYAFARNVYRLTRPTRDVGELHRAANLLGEIPSEAGGPLYGSLIRIMTDAAQAGGPAARAAVVLSEGWDRECTVPGPSDVIQTAVQLGFALYPVALIPETYAAQDAAFGPFKGLKGEKIRDPQAYQRVLLSRQFFLQIGRKTGGIGIQRYNLADTAIHHIFLQMLRETHPMYLAGYHPAHSQTPIPHHAEVVLRVPELGKVTGGVRTVVH